MQEHLEETDLKPEWMQQPTVEAFDTTGIRKGGKRTSTASKQKQMSLLIGQQKSWMPHEPTPC